MLTLAVLGGTQTFAQVPYQRPAGAADPLEPVIVAGYRALFTCSAHFIARRPLEDIKRVELVDVSRLGYPDPVIDEQRKQVSASDPSGQVIMRAAWRPGLGCSVLPQHWTEADATRLPDITLPAPQRAMDQAFPKGERVDLPPSGIAPGHARLEPVLQSAFDGRSYADRGPAANTARPETAENTSGVVSTAVLIMQGDRVIAERYRPGFGPYSGYRTWSTSKSFTAALMAIAQGHGILNLEAPADIPEWQTPGDARQAITYKHLLWMSSGLFSGGSNTNAIYFGGQDVISAVTGTTLEATPGTRWKYANNDTLLLMRALRHRLRDDARYWRFPYVELLHPIGMRNTFMEVDHLGNFVASSQTYTTARDLARFGLLMARDGVWEGRRLLPKGWVAFATTPAPTKAVTPGQRGYGAQFWLLDQMPGVPAGTFTTAGNKGQFVTIVPGHDLVIVRTGVDPEGTRWQESRFVADVVTALKSPALSGSPSAD